MKNEIIKKAAKMFARHLEGLFFAFLEGRISYDEYKDYFQQETEEYIDHLTKEIQEQDDEEQKR